MMAIHKTLQILNTKYPNEPAKIFTDCINALYLLNTKIQHPAAHNNHLDKTLLASMVQLLKSRTQPTNLHKVRAHVGFEENERANELTKTGSCKDHKHASQLYEHAHTIPHDYQRKEWPSMDETPHKGPIRFLANYLKNTT